jgi:ADP-ribosylglycohydrolase
MRQKKEVFKKEASGGIRKQGQGGVVMGNPAWILTMADFLEVDDDGNLTGLGLEVQKLKEAGVDKAKAIAMARDQYFKDLHAKTFDRAQGCLMGQLVGDSLGSLVEFKSPKEIRKLYPGGVRDLADGGPFDLLAGQPTDDSEMALALARTLVERGDYDQKAARDAYVSWLKSNPFDCGLTLAGALRGDMSPESQANGAMMRISPLGIWAAQRGHLPPTDDAFEQWKKEDQGKKCYVRYAPIKPIDRWAEEDAQITHPNPVCVDVNILYVRAIAEAISNISTPEKLYREIAEWAQDAEDIVKEAARAAQDSPPSSYTQQMGWVLIAFQNALYQLLHAHSFEEALVDTVMRGGDTDTNAAICGALLGAAYGLEAIPERWREAVLNCKPSADNPKARRPRPEHYWPTDALTLAKQLLRGPNAS